MKWRQGFVAAGVVVVVLSLFFAPIASASISSSPNYGVDEVFFGSGGELNACSSSYCAKQSAAEIAAGNTAATAFRAVGGFNTNREPYLAFSVAGSSTDLGYLSQAGTATTVGTFAVKTYLASGYVVQLASNPPTNVANPSHDIDGLTSPTASAFGTEQFGINLVHNTSPASLNAISADPVQFPDNTFSFGTVATGYDTPNLFKYVKGDTIASSDRSSGETDYTISFIYNISSTTADGTYEFNGTLVATSTF
jgi:hypothetical protein